MCTVGRAEAGAPGHCDLSGEVAELNIYVAKIYIDL